MAEFYLGSSAMYDYKTYDQNENKSSPLMNAIMCIEVGQQDLSKSIQCQAVPKPTVIKPNDVMVEIYAGAISQMDYKMAIKKLRFAAPRKPYIVGNDFCGIIASIGPDVTKYKIGDAVCGKMAGSFCEYIVIDSKYIHKIPLNMTFAEAAGISLVGLTSYEALITRAKLKKNDKILILGGSTSCGLMAIQIAKYFGCSAITVTSTRKELCEYLGATQVINYKEFDWKKELKDKGYDVIYDCIGGDIWNDAQNVMCDTGYFVTICGDDGDAKIGVGTVLNMGWKMLKRKSSNWMGGKQSYDMFLTGKDASNLAHLFQMFEENKLKVVIDKSVNGYNMNNCYEMFEKSQTKTSHGKLIINIKKYDQNKTIKELGLNQNDENDSDNESVDEFGCFYENAENKKFGCF